MIVARERERCNRTVPCWEVWAGWGGGGCYVRWGGVWGERTTVGCFKGDPGGAEEVTGGEFGGYKEECTLTFLACPPHCSRLMSRGRERALPWSQREDKTTGAPAGIQRLSSRLRNSKRRTWEGKARRQQFSNRSHTPHTDIHMYIWSDMSQCYRWWRERLETKNWQCTLYWWFISCFISLFNTSNVANLEFHQSS